MLKKFSVIVVVLVLVIATRIGAVALVGAQPPLFSINCLVTAGKSHDYSVATLISESLAKIGINLEVTYMEPSAMGARLWSDPTCFKTYDEGGWDSMFMHLGHDLAFSSKMFVPWADWSVSYNNEIVTMLEEQALKEPNATKREELFSELWTEAVRNDPSILVLYWPKYGFIHRSGVEIIIQGEPYKYTPNFPAFSNFFFDYYWTPGEGKDTVVYGLVTEPDHWIQWFSSGCRFTAPLVSGLYHCQIDPETGGAIYVPDLATSYDMSADGTVWTFHLRKGVKFHDGVEFMARDVKFSYDVQLDPDISAVMNAGWRDHIESVDIIDNYTVRFHLDEYSYDAIDWFADHHASIYPEHILGDIPVEDLRTHLYNSESPPPTTGPYKLVKWEAGAYAEYEVFGDYFGGIGDNQAKTVILKILKEPVTALAAFEAGEVDALHGRSYFMDLLPEVERLEQDPDIVVDVPVIPNAVTATFQVNHANPMLGNKYVRLAIAHAIPYDQITELISPFFERANYYGAKGASGAPTLEDAPLFEYDLEKARDYLKQAGLPEYPAYIYNSPPSLSAIPLWEWIQYPVISALAGVAVGAVVMQQWVKRKTKSS